MSTHCAVALGALHSYKRDLVASSTVVLAGVGADRLLNLAATFVTVATGLRINTHDYFLVARNISSALMDRQFSGCSRTRIDNLRSSFDCDERGE